MKKTAGDNGHCEVSDKEFLAKQSIIYEKEITFIRQAHDKLFMPAGENS